MKLIGKGILIMNKHKRLMVIMLALIMTAMTLFAGCGSGGSSGGVQSTQQTVTVGKKVYVDDSGVVFFGYQNLICTALLKDGEITEFIPEGGTTGNIYGMAVYNDELYISAQDGMFKYPISMFTSGETNASATVLLSPDQALSPFSHFEICDGKVFFISGASLCCIPTDGGERKTLAEEVVDFEVTDKGIYYTKANGDMMIIAPSLDQEKNAGNIGGVKFTPGGMNFYYRLDEKLMAYSVEKEAAEEVTTDKGVYEYCIPFSNGDSVLYFDNDGMYFHLVSGGRDTAYEQTRLTPYKADAAVAGDWLIAQSDNWNVMELISLKDGTYKSYELSTEMKDQLAKLGYGGTGNTGKDSAPAPQTSSGSYDVMKNFSKNTNSAGDIQYLYFNDFMLTLPNADDITYEANGDSVDIIFVPGKNAGYGGKLVTIRAYDMNDDSYENLPNYHVAGAGQNVNKRFVAIYPTDLQVSQEFESVVLRYKELYDYLYKIGEGAVNSPLQTSDSSPAP